MPKIRGIKPEFWIDEKIVSLTIPVRLFFIGLWNFCDDCGVFEWKPLELKNKIFPADNFNTTSALRELVAKNCVLKFTKDKKDFGLIINFTKHQRPDKRFLIYLFDDEINFLKDILRGHHESTTRPRVDIEGEGEGDVDVDIVPNGTSAARKSYGNESINAVLVALKEAVGIEAFVDSSIERNMGKHLVDLIGKIGEEEFRRRLDILLTDSFHHKNCNKIKYIYNQIKGFIEPKREGVFIS